MFKYGPKQGKKHNNKDATWAGHFTWFCLCVSVCVANQLGAPRAEEKQENSKEC